MAWAQAPLIDPLWVDLEDFDASNRDFYDTIQGNLHDLGEVASTMAQILWGKEAANFLDSGTGHELMSFSWRAVRLLGKGGFGLVGLWRQHDEHNEIVDEIAIKESRIRPWQGLGLDRRPSLAKEAVVMKQLNTEEHRLGMAVRNILRLRSFKHFPASRRWRFYLEFAPYGDLSNLTYSYRGWDTYLPEEFLWHVFYSLAKAAYVMETGVFTDPETGDPISGAVVHFDIKPENIYMARPHPDSHFTNYPTVKLADYGLAEITGEHDDSNPLHYRQKGTDGYRPPEQRSFATSWQRPPNSHWNVALYPSNDPYFTEKTIKFTGNKYLSAHNVWAVGKVVYDMMTLSYGFQLDEEMDDETTEENYWGSLDQNPIDPIRTRRRPEYSLKLRTLIRDCLQLAITKRPTASQLLEHTEEGLKEAAESASEDRKGRRVFFMGNEINHMPLGNAHISMTRHDMDVIRREANLNPSRKTLLPGRWAPEVVNGALVNEPIIEGGPKADFPIPPLYATVQRNFGPLDHINRGVQWQLHAQPQPGLGHYDGDGNDPGDDPGGNPGDGKDERQGRIKEENTEGLSKPIRDRFVTHKPTPEVDHMIKRSRGPTLSEAFRYLANAAEEMAQPPRNLPHPPVAQRSKSNTPLRPSPRPITLAKKPPRGTKRARIMGLSVDDEGHRETEGHNVHGHNLRKRRR